jgi:hypothetical protein
LAKELKNLDESPPEGIKVIVNDDDFSTIFADIEGPGKIYKDIWVFSCYLFVIYMPVLPCWYAIVPALHIMVCFSIQEFLIYCLFRVEHR